MEKEKKLSQPNSNHFSEPCAARLRDGFDLLNAELQLQDNWERVATELNLK
jgi:hypothetical protein